MTTATTPSAAPSATSPPPALDRDPADVALRVLGDAHRSLEAVLRTMPLVADERGPDDAPPDFPALRALLCYLAEYPERVHHPQEERLLFPLVRRAAPQLARVLDDLGREHHSGEARLGRLERLLTAWEWLGEAHRAPFRAALDTYVDFYLAHLQREEREVFPVARAVLTREQWQAVADDVASPRDPLRGPRDAAYDTLLETLLDLLPPPYGLRAA